MTAFPPLRRSKQALSPDRCREILREEKRGVLSLLGNEGYPYGIPIDYFYDETDDALYFHCATSGHKNDAIAKCDKASFCVYVGQKDAEEWFFRFESVVLFGRISFVEDEAKKKEICSALAKKFGQTDEYAAREWERFRQHVSCLSLRIEHMTGKRIKEE